jgi:trehalose 6-phosphate phosphatase
MSDFLFDHSVHINKKILRSDALFLFLDYDGTLVPFKEKPTQVKTPEKIKKVLLQLQKNPAIIVSIVTGRTLKNIKKLLIIKGVSFIALHGLQIESSDGSQFRWKPAEHARSTLESIKENMQRELKGEKGAYLEDKELTVVLHYRLLPKNRIHIVREKFITVVHDNDKKKNLEIIHGAKVIEARPKGWNKGKAIETFLAGHTEVKNKRIIYIGDDITDEDAFRFLRKRGITIHVANQSKRETVAQYWVKNPAEVLRFLQSLSQLVNQR